MAITIQLTEVPQNENVTNRVFTLPKQGGTFGSSFDCMIELPDRSGQVAAIHGQFIANKHNMGIEAFNGNKIKINGTTLASGRIAPIEDGSMIEVADYMMLISQVNDSNSNDIEKDSFSQAKFKDVHFSLDGIQDNDLEEDIIMKNDKKQISQGVLMSEDQQPHFINNGVFVDDPFDEDPFKDEDISLKQESNSTGVQNETDVFTAEPINSNKQDNLIFEHQTIKSDSAPEPVNNTVNTTKIDHLVRLLDTQIVSANEQQSNLFQALDKTLTTFMEEFSPKHLEDVYSDFGTPLFASKEKQYWRLYRKSFNRRLDKGDYHRLFKALLLENMQTKD
ncbi:type VI secretion system-associated FHA domain protein [Pseudoalteromonas denitrificans]|uniref:FHA domain protein n=1 Tax=Pseudoalteromonas denitrificans DSM 6059 TaxID=1123010 RepID=A0A1I1GLJ6_9GAMM|nr:type VI secretion system-associated FHA domain protein [Pseudoalteromonas denitrificans]SFC12637.1 FHA domain protein [Pseudoalteromonas denitrificans DSM 6059]